LNISAPPLSMRLARDVLPPHRPSTQLTIAFKRRFSCLFVSFCTRTWNQTLRADADVECVSVLFVKPCIHHLFRPNGFIYRPPDAAME
jgi:hypothetical protein